MLVVSVVVFGSDSCSILEDALGCCSSSFAALGGPPPPVSVPVLVDGVGPEVSSYCGWRLSKMFQWLQEYQGMPRQ